MAKVRSWVGLDVHARSVLAVMIDGESGEQRTRRLSGATSEVVEFCGSLPGPTRVAYEAGPTGYGLARALGLAGVGCVVAAPGKIERPSADRVKTDQRDAERVLRLLMIDGLHAVRVPSSEEEALRAWLTKIDLGQLVRYRKAKIQERTREVQRVEKTLQDAGIKLSSVASEVLGKSARLMLDALISGTHDPEILAELAKGSLRKKIPALREALALPLPPRLFSIQ